jgi:hypothetical protein
MAVLTNRNVLWNRQVEGLWEDSAQTHCGARQTFATRAAKPVSGAAQSHTLRHEKARTCGPSLLAQSGDGHCAASGQSP